MTGTSKHILGVVLAVAAAVGLWGCGEPDNFSVNGTVKPAGTYGLKVYYYTGSSMGHVPAAARQGKFSFQGRSKQPTIVDILGTDGRVLAQFVARNGQDLSVDIDMSQPRATRVSGGDDVNGRWRQWLIDNATTLQEGDTRAINTAVEAYVARHPDDMLSTCLMVTQYDWSLDPAKALRLLDGIDVAARPESLTDGTRLLASRLASGSKNLTLQPIRHYTLGDTLATWSPRGHGRVLLALTGYHGALPDSIARALRHLPAHNRDAVLELSVDADTASWRRAVSRDSLTWRRGWRPGGVEASGINHLSVPVLPYFFVADDRGRVLVATPSVAKAVKAWQQ